MPTASRPIEVSNGDQLRAALKAAKPYDEISLLPMPAGAPYRGPFKCSVSNVTIRSSDDTERILSGSDASQKDVLFLNGARGCNLQNLTMRDGESRGLYAVRADGLEILGCKGLANGITGALVAYTNNLVVRTWEGSDNKEQHGMYFSNHGCNPTFEDIRGERNGRTCLQLNADWRFEPYNEQTVITGARISNVFGKDNGGPSMNLFGVHGAIIEDIQLLDGKSGGLNLSNDDQHDWPGYGSKNNVFRRVRITGARGISVRKYSTGNMWFDTEVDVAGGPCVEWDDTVRSCLYFDKLFTWQPGSGHKPFSYESREYMTWATAMEAVATNTA